MRNNLCPECLKWEQYTIMNKAIAIIRSCETTEQLQSAERFIDLAKSRLEHKDYCMIAEKYRSKRRIL